MHTEQHINDGQTKQWQLNALPKKALWQMRFRGALSAFSMLAVFACIYGVIRLLKIEINYLTPIFMGIVGMCVFLFVFRCITATIQYNYTAYHIDEEGVLIRQGLLWRAETFVLRSRVQHIDVLQDPMSRLFGLATIKVYTAGTKLGSISLSGLGKLEAEYIRNELITLDVDTL